MKQHDQENVEKERRLGALKINVIDVHVFALITIVLHITYS